MSTRKPTHTTMMRVAALGTTAGRARRSGKHGTPGGGGAGTQGGEGSCARRSCLAGGLEEEDNIHGGPEEANCLRSGKRNRTYRKQKGQSAAAAAQAKGTHGQGGRCVEGEWAGRRKLWPSTAMKNPNVSRQRARTGSCLCLSTCAFPRDPIA
jgi:hypothetical protein